MWFFKKNASPDAPEENLTLDLLMPYAKSVFEKTLEEFSNSSEEYITIFESAKKEFIEACHVLEKYSGEPNVEDMWAPNINSIKAQKSAYTKTLERVLEKNKEGSFDTTYGKYKAELTYMDETISEMLRVNSMFKIIVMSYSNELNQFKKIFSNMERVRDKLRISLDEIEPDHRKYEDIRNKIENLYGMTEEISLMDENKEGLSKDISLFENSDNTTIAEKLKKTIIEKNNKLGSLNKEIAAISLQLSNILMPIERAARKMDYSYSGGKSLVSYIEKPLENFKSEHDYIEFNNLLNSLFSLVESDKILLKGKEVTLSQINKINNSNINELIIRLSSLDKELHILKEEIFSDEQDIKENLSKTSILAEKKKEFFQMEERKNELINSINSTKRRIEELFFTHYKKKIKII